MVKKYFYNSLKEDAGLKISSVSGTRTGVFIGASNTEWSVMQFSSRAYDGIGAHTNTGSALSIISNRVSYLLDLRGPSMTVDTACSSSLLAVHLAVNAIRRGECSMANEQWFSAMNDVKEPVLRVFCIPFHLAGPSAFALWSEALQKLAPRVALFVARIPGWETRESEQHPASFSDAIRPMADTVSAIVGADEVPYVVYGHSVGGLLAFELVRALSRQPRAPARLLVGACAAPSWFVGKNSTDAFTMPGHSTERGVVYSVKEGERVACPVTAFVAGADDVFSEESVKLWSAFGPEGSFSAVELGPKCPHLFLGVAGQDSPSLAVLRSVVEPSGLKV
eukprot:m51a1_g11215 putative polyketide synthase (336) ;mRNA; f:20869-24210